ncbi:MAG: hypothetical protein L3J47_00210 [Sulfurovum sp.]|nr:hypothetical protein [Sulfurovum sp.]
MKLRVEAEIQGFKVVLHKNSAFMLAIHFVLKVLSLGKVVPARYTTTIGKTMYVPNNWPILGDQAKYAILRHEVVHLRQFRQWPFRFLDYRGLRLVNALLFGVAYLLALPTLWTLRAKFEREAYTQTMLVVFEDRGEFTTRKRQALARNMGIHFGGPGYLYMWNRARAKEWANKVMDDIESGKITNTMDQVYET